MPELHIALLAEHTRIVRKALREGASKADLQRLDEIEAHVFGWEA